MLRVRVFAPRYGDQHMGNQTQGLYTNFNWEQLDNYPYVPSKQCHNVQKLAYKTTSFLGIVWKVESNTGFDVNKLFFKNIYLFIII